MTQLTWDGTGERLFETGVDHGVLYKQNVAGAYDTGYAWNGLTAVNESPSGAESNKQYADNQVYLNLLSAEEFGATIECFTYPKEFEECDGSVSLEPGVVVGQQNRKQFGFSYRTKIGNDLDGQDHGYKIHLVYGALAAPSEKAYNTVNESPEAITFSYEVTTTPVAVPGLKPTATMVIDSTLVDGPALANLEELLYGTEGVDPQLPLPADVHAIFAGTLTEVSPTAPTFNSTTDTITIPSVTGVIYKIDGVPVAAGPVVITENEVVTASPDSGYKFPPVTDNDWLFVYTP